MKKINIIKPQAMSVPIANSGAKDAIPNSATGTNYCSVAEGFPLITMKDILTEGGEPPRGQGANGLFYISTDQKVYLQNGGIITFDEDVSSLIGGYPEGAILNYVVNGINHQVISLIDDNTYNFVSTPSYIDGEHWDFTENGSLTRKLSYGILEAPNGIVTITSTSITAKAGLKFLCPNGRNTDGSLKNYVHTLTEDLTTTTPTYSPLTFVYLASADNGANWHIGHRNYTNQYFEQTTQPILPDGNNGTWYNPDTNLAKSTNNNWSTSIDYLICPLGLSYNDTSQTDHPIIKFVQFNTIKLLSFYDRLTGFDEPDWINKTDYQYNTSYTIPEDGWIYFMSKISVSTSSSVSPSNIVISGTVDTIPVYYNFLYLSSSQTITNQRTERGIYRVYKGQTVKIETIVQTGTASITNSGADYVFRFYPIKRGNYDNILQPA